ncbi:hypothetical protein [Actinomadura madurae]|uniref:hypothetical protein n=1 Tax=Actinomadura madurae TaxID=1993 RepID=UPI0020D21154|nr:hypothetical protein [Actinomadura madurae]MCQ0015344.1 hypothetical protein [Actinomadura madurae]
MSMTNRIASLAEICCGLSWVSSFDGGSCRTSRLPGGLADEALVDVLQPALADDEVHGAAALRVLRALLVGRADLLAGALHPRVLLVLVLRPLVRGELDVDGVAVGDRGAGALDRGARLQRPGRRQLGRDLDLGLGGELAGHLDLGIGAVDPPVDAAGDRQRGDHDPGDHLQPALLGVLGGQPGRPVQPAAAPRADAVRGELRAADVLGARDLRLDRRLAPGLVILGHVSSLATGSTTPRT